MFVNLVWVVIAFVWRRRKGRSGGREKESVCEIGGSGRGREGEQPRLEIAAIHAPKRETRLTPCTRASRLRDASVQKESSSAPVALLTGLPRFRLFAHLSGVRGRFRQSSWSEDDLLISGR